MPQPSCVVVIPTYNEEKCIFNVLREWHLLLNSLFSRGDFRILVVNDGSRDKTGEVLKHATAVFPELQVINQENGGHGRAIQTGYQEAIRLGAEWVFQIDSDDQFDPTDFTPLWKLRHQSLFILGRRKSRQDALHRLILTKLVRIYVLLLTFKLIPDANIPFRLIRGSYLKFLLQFVPKNALTPNIFLSGLAAAEGINLVHVEVNHRGRKTGIVSIRRWKLAYFCLRTARQLFSLPVFIRRVRMQSNRYFLGDTKHVSS